MKTTPKSLRLQIGIFGKTNVGKSSILNLIAGQDVSITSPHAGTTTDVVEKSMELLPIGPVVLLDTAGLDDNSILSEKRIEKTTKIFDRADIILLITEPNIWTDFDEYILKEAEKRKTPYIIIVNKIDIQSPTEDFINTLKNKSKRIVFCSCQNFDNRDKYINQVKSYILEMCPDEILNPPSILGDLLQESGIAVFIIPIDKEAPKGRLILPQVQSIRDTLDNDGFAMVVKENEYAQALKTLNKPPDIVVCDSQVVLKMVADTPKDVKCTTFSILFSRYKGDLVEAAHGAGFINKIQQGDKILIAEACSHHAIEDDIGRIKIPKWLKQYLGINVKIDVCAGRDYPENLSQYKLIIHCGACMITKREMLSRIQKAREANVPITNYGICISLLQGVIERVLSPFPEALEVYKTNLK